MSYEALVQTLMPLVNLCRGDKKVGDVAIFPTSAFGFGNSIAGDDEDDEFATNARSSGTGDFNPATHPTFLATPTRSDRSTCTHYWPGLS